MKNVACLQLYRTDVKGGNFTIYRDILENRQVARTFKLVNPEHKDQLKVFSKYIFLLFK